MKQRGETIDVRLKRGWPVGFRWRNRSYRVLDMVDFWVVQGRWWSSEEKRVYFRVRTDRGTFELYRSDTEWKMARELD